MTFGAGHHLLSAYIQHCFSGVEGGAMSSETAYEKTMPIPILKQS
jgi:hypothetical protein